jgi:hypothetical protein
VYALTLRLHLKIHGEVREEAVDDVRLVAFADGIEVNSVLLRFQGSRGKSVGFRA